MIKRCFNKSRKLAKSSTIAIAFILVLILISSSTVSITINNQFKSENNCLKILEEKIPISINSLTGLAPNNALKSSILPTTLASSRVTCKSNKIATLSPRLGETMYGYCAELGPHGEGPCYFDVEDPGDIIQLSNNELPNFAAGGTWTPDERWLVCEYSNGALYEIDPETGDITKIGGGGVGLNGLCIDPTTLTLYGCSSYDLYKIDQEDGSQEYIGSFGTGQTHIAIACDSDGTMHTWDVKFSGDSYLYEVDKETGEATQLFSLGKTLLYAQDGDWSYDHNGLYLTAYINAPESGGYLCYVDFDSETLEIVDEFENSAEITGSMFKNCIWKPDRDVGIKSIDKPEDGYAGEDMDIEVTVKNYGNTSEFTDVQFEIKKFDEGPLLIYEDFSGTFPPSGWETDYWQQSSSNNAGGDPPEAHVNKNWVEKQYINYIQTRPINATDYENIKLKFRMYADFYYPQYCYFYLKYRKNDASPWRDASPWSNPPGKDLGPKYYEFDIYGWGEDLGEEFQVRWELNNYYYYFNDIYLDDISFYGGTDCDEYDDLVEDVEVPYDEEVEVEFEKWTPSQWHNPEYQDTWEEYLLTANTLLEDDNERNDKKQKILSLYFPFLHDVGAFALNGPETGPAQSFGLEGEIRNVGQYEECCFKTNVEIAEIDFETSEELFSENFPSCNPWPPTGWSRTHTNWKCSNSNKAGGTSPEARFYYYPISYPDEFRFASPGIDTGDYGAVEIEFKSRNNYSYGNYKMTVETSTDGVTWDEVWATSGTHGPETVKIITGENVGGSNFHIAFTVKTRSYSILYWSVDDIIVRGFPMYDAEYEDQYCIDKIKAGETWEIEFDNWTPDFLQYETTGTKTYKARIWTNLFDPEDSNHANDELGKFITLDFFHDPAVDEMYSPPDFESDRMHFAVDCSGYPSNSRFVWFDPEDSDLTFNDIGKYPNSNFPQSATFVGDEMWFCDTYGNIFKKTDPLSEEYISVGSSGTGELVGLSYHEKTKILYGMSTKNFYTIDMDTGKATMVGSMGNSGLMISLDCDYDGVMYSYELGIGTGYTYTIDLDTGKAIKIGQTGVSMDYAQDMAYDWAEETMYACVFNYNTFRGELHYVDLDTGKFTYIGTLDGGSGPQTTTYAIEPHWCLDVYIPLGNQEIIAIAKNYGTFPERDMSCTAEINEYISNCKYGTLVYEDLIEDIDILTPLVGEETLTFDDYNFTKEGKYVIYVNITDENDDYLSNNYLEWELFADDTHPDSMHTLDPPEPDGENGWYVGDLEVSLNAKDSEINCGHHGSGVSYIKYQIDDGAIETIYGTYGTFIVTRDSNLHTLKYWSIDYVGNKEPEHSFQFKMDQTGPNIKAEWDAYKKGGKWHIKFTCNSYDDTSGMDRVEMYINEGLVRTITGPGPTYEFDIEWSSAFRNSVFKFIGFDKAGNSAFTELEGIKTKSDFSTQSNSHQLINIWLTRLSDRFLFLQKLFAINGWYIC